MQVGLQQLLYRFFFVFYTAPKYVSQEKATVGLQKYELH